MITNIQTLRAIAALIVIIYHAVGTSEKYNMSTNFFYGIDRWGGAGVDIFFVISGFIMIYIQHKKRKKPIAFMKDRIERIVPLYWFLTLFITFLFIVFPQGFNDNKFNIESLSASLLFYNFLSNVEPLIYVGWTLEYEMLFYLVFGLSLFIRNEKISIAMCVGCLVALVFFGLNSIVIEFVYGMIIGFIYNHYKVNINNLFCIVMIILGFLLLNAGINSISFRFLNWGIPSVLIFLGFLYSKPFKSKILEILGSASYSIYLVQVFSIPIFYKILLKLPFFEISYSAEIYVILCTIFSALAGVALYFLIEKPMAHVIKSIKQRKLKSNLLVGS